MHLELLRLGWNDFFAAHFQETPHAAFTPARVIEQLKGHYRVASVHGESLAQLSGAFRHDAADREDMPAVGDWVGVEMMSGNDRAVIHSLYPRKTKLCRKAAGRVAHEQILAANVGTVFIVSALNKELNVRRIERYVALAWDSGAIPIVLLNKSDLAVDASALQLEIEAKLPGVDVIALSAVTRVGFESLSPHLSRGKTCVFLGSSGVGKSTIVNALLGEHSQSTGDVRASDDRGRHTTTSRQLFVLPEGSIGGGAIVIDTPGMRELQLWDASDGLSAAFDDLTQAARCCRFRDCQHDSEPGCAVRSAIDAGDLKADRLENYQKLRSEARYLETKTDVQAAHTAKKRMKKLCGGQKRMYKHND